MFRFLFRAADVVRREPGEFEAVLVIASAAEIL